ncbi:unnamed protein product [Diamesa hyperborea]
MSTITKQLFNLSIAKQGLCGKTCVYNQVFRTVFNFAENDEANEKIDVEQLQNKSRLLNAHRNMLHGNLPYDQAQSWVHQTLKYKRKMYAKYGAESGIDPRICFLTESELKEVDEYNKVAFPLTIQEMITKNNVAKKERNDKVMKRETDIAKNLEKLEQWKTDIENKKSKKMSEAKAAKERKDRIVEEVRRHFGFKVDSRDDRFKEMLEMKEREDKKRQKEAKRKLKEAKVMEKMVEKNTSETKTSDV